MRWLRALLGRRRGGERSVHALLRQRGASRSLRRFAEPYGADVEAFWTALPRATWALRSAARLGVSRGLVAAALANLAEQARERRDRPEERPSEPPGLLARPASLRGGVSEPLLVETAELGRAFVSRRMPVERFAGEVTQLLLAIIDADPSVREVQAQIEEAQRWGRLDEVLRAMDAHDAAYATRHEAMAKVVRRHIRAQDVIDALRGSSGHPYR